MIKKRTTERRVGVVLGLYVLPNGKADLASRLRVERAVDMLHSGELSHVIFSGGKNPFTIGNGRKTTEAFAMIEHAKRYAREICLATHRWNWTSENASRNTVQNAHNCLPWVRHWKPSQVLVFTHPQHVDRTQKIFKQAGYEDNGAKLKVVSVPVVAQHSYQEPFVAAFNAIAKKVERLKNARRKK